MSENGTGASKTKDWDTIVQQIYDMIGTNTAIIDQYGIILASRIQKFQAKTLLSPVIWEFIMNRQKMCEELKINSLKSLVMETDEKNIVVTIADRLFLLSEIEKSVDLAQYMPSISRIMKSLEQTAIDKFNLMLKSFDIDAECSKLQTHVKDQVGNDHYPIFKHIIRYMSKKKK